MSTQLQDECVSREELCAMDLDSLVRFALYVGIPPLLIVEYYGCIQAIINKWPHGPPRALFDNFLAPVLPPISPSQSSASMIVTLPAHTTRTEKIPTTQTEPASPTNVSSTVWQEPLATVDTGLNSPGPCHMEIEEPEDLRHWQDTNDMPPSTNGPSTSGTSQSAPLPSRLPDHLEASLLLRLPNRPKWPPSSSSIVPSLSTVCRVSMPSMSSQNWPPVPRP